MKIERLIGILAVLLQQEKVTAPYLASKFEVSRRTINRDIEDLCRAGIPLVTTQGAGGGISIMEGYKFDGTVLTASEMQAILAGLKGLDSVSGTAKYRQLIHKLMPDKDSAYNQEGRICIDLAAYSKPYLAPKLDLIQKAADNHFLLSFDYYAPKGESSRTIEPYSLIFQWSAWYVWGFCLKRQAMRLFKIGRMQRLALSGDTFEPREILPYHLAEDKIFPARIQAAALFSPAMRWRLIDEYGIESFEETGDGRLLFRSGFADKEMLFGWILSFGENAQLIEPEPLCRELAVIAGRICRQYEEALGTDVQ